MQVETTKADGKPWDLPSEKSGSLCALVAVLGKAAGGVVGGAIATFICSRSSRSQEERDPTAPDIFVQVVAGDTRYQTYVAVDTFQEAFDFPMVVPVDGIPPAGLEIQVLDQDADVGSGELIGLVRLNRREVRDALAAGTPLITRSDGRVNKLELEISNYDAPRTPPPIAFDVHGDPIATSLRVRPGEMVTLHAHGTYSVADDREQIDENGYIDGRKRGYNRTPDFEHANHAAAIAYIGAPNETHTALVVGSCVSAVSPTAGILYVGVNDGQVDNNQGTVTFNAQVGLPTVEQWKSGGAFTCAHYIP